MAEQAGVAMQIGFKTRLKYLLATAPGVFLLDFVSKRLVLRHMEPYGATVELIDNIARLRFIWNEGIVFGFSPGIFTGTPLAVVSAVVALVLTGYLLFAQLDGRQTLVALSLIVGGAAGNLYDRLAWGRVVDFLEIGVGEVTWPVFNVADIAVTAGAVLLAWRILTSGGRESEPAGQPDVD